MPRLYQANFLLDDEHNNNNKSASRMGEPSGFGRFASEFGHRLQSDTVRCAFTSACVSKTAVYFLTNLRYNIESGLHVPAAPLLPMIRNI